MNSKRTLRKIIASVVLGLLCQTFFLLILYLKPSKYENMLLALTTILHIIGAVLVITYSGLDEKEKEKERINFNILGCFLAPILGIPFLVIKHGYILICILVEKYVED